jgi:hypothetical protein
MFSDSMAKLRSRRRRNPTHRFSTRCDGSLRRRKGRWSRALFQAFLSGHIRQLGFERKLVLSRRALCYGSATEEWAFPGGVHIRNLAILAIAALLAGVLLSALVQRGTDDDRRAGGVAYPSRFGFIFVVFVVVMLVGSFFVKW